MNRRIFEAEWRKILRILGDSVFTLDAGNVRRKLLPLIRIGFQVWGQAITWPDLMAAGERIEALGFSSLWGNDHLMPILGDADGPVLGAHGPVFEGWMTLAGWTQRTTRIPLGMMVSGVGYRNVGLTVKMATAIVTAMPRAASGVSRPAMSAIPPPNSAIAAAACRKPGN